MLEFINEPWQAGIAVIGTAASLSSVFLAEPNLRSRALHVCYTGAIVLIVFLMTSYNSRLQTALTKVENEASLLAVEIDNLSDIRARAAALHKTMYDGADEGRNIGNVFQAISFFETYQERYGKSLELLLAMSNTVGLTSPAETAGTREAYRKRDTLEQIGDAARQLVLGVAAGG